MQVADTLSRRKTAVRASGGESPGEKDPYFHYENEEVGNITFVKICTLDFGKCKIYPFLTIFKENGSTIKN
jgi:hypothetical protein